MPDEPNHPQASSLQEAFRQLFADAQASAQTNANVSEMSRRFDAVCSKLDRHLADSERDRANTEQAMTDLRAGHARVEAELRRLANERAAERTLDEERVAREVKAAALYEARWKERGAILATLAGLATLVIKEVVEWIRKP